MAEANGVMQWNQTGLLAALLFNSHRKKGTALKAPDDFNPYKEHSPAGGATSGIPIRAANISLLKLLLPKHKRNTKKKTQPPASEP